MKQLRRTATLFFVISLLFARIEFISLATDSVTGAQLLLFGSDFVLLLSLALILLIPAWGRRSLTWPLLVWLLLFLGLKLPLVWGSQLNLIEVNLIEVQTLIAEFSIMTLLVFLAHRLSRLLCQFEEAVADMALDTEGLHRHYLSRDLADEQIRMEFTRAREGQRPLSLLIIEPTSADVPVILGKMLEEIRQTIVNRYTFLRMAQVIRQRLRLSDLIVQEGSIKRIVLLCPEADEIHSGTLLKQIDSTLQAQLGLRIKGTAATFPQDGFTFDGLVANAEHKLLHSHSISKTNSTLRHTSAPVYANVDKDVDKTARVNSAYHSSANDVTALKES